MFQGLAGLTLDSDHLDISYRNPDVWPQLTPTGSIRAFIFNIGDEEVGPCVQLGLIQPVEGETLDWRHVVDPLHHHGSDQFRVIMSESWNLAGRRLEAGDYAYQEAGLVYQEHPGPGGAATTMLIMGDKRGNQATIALKKDEASMFQYDEVYGAPKAGQAYPHPAGNRGIAAIATSEGPCEKGYLRGDIGALEEGEAGAVSGLFGDETAGPVSHVMRYAANSEILPETQWNSEVIITVVDGSIHLGDLAYASGELRVQRSDTLMPAVHTGPDGAEVVVLVGDRRATVQMPESREPPKWYHNAAALQDALVPVVGGPQAVAEAEMEARKGA